MPWHMETVVVRTKAESRGPLVSPAGVSVCECPFGGRPPAGTTVNIGDVGIPDVDRMNFMLYLVSLSSVSVMTPESDGGPGNICPDKLREGLPTTCERGRREAVSQVAAGPGRLVEVVVSRSREKDITDQ